MPGSIVSTVPPHERRVAARRQERRLVDVDADRVAGTVQARAELRRGLDDRALGGVDVAPAGTGAGDLDRARLRVACTTAHAACAHSLGSPATRAAREVGPVAVDLRRDVGADHLAAASRRGTGLAVRVRGVGAEQHERVRVGRAGLAQQVRRRAR